MKAVSGLLVVVLVIMVIAVNGSRAQPLSGSSVAFRQCLQHAQEPAGRCAPVVSAMAGDDLGGDQAGQAAGAEGAFGDYGYGEDLATPDFWKEIFVVVAVTVAEELAKRVADRFFGGAWVPDLTAAVPAMVFDPMK